MIYVADGINLAYGNNLDDRRIALVDHIVSVFVCLPYRQFLKLIYSYISVC